MQITFFFSELLDINPVLINAICTSSLDIYSDNTKRLNLEETKAKIASLEYIQNELNGIPNIVK